MESSFPAGKRREEGKGEMQREVSMNPEGKLTGGYRMEGWKREKEERHEKDISGVRAKKGAEQNKTGLTLDLCPQ